MVKERLLDLDVKESAVPDDIHAKVLKELYDVIATFCGLFKCLSKGQSQSFTKNVEKLLY